MAVSLGLDLEMVAAVVALVELGVVLLSQRHGPLNTETITRPATHKGPMPGATL